METKGIIIYALGHPNYLGMAVNLAASLLYNEPVKIQLLTDAGNYNLLLNSQAKTFFDDITLVPEELYLVNGKLVFNHAMMHMYELSKYDKTIKLDADMIWMPGRKPSELFDQLDACDFSCSNKGFGWDQRNSVWANIDEIKSKYKLTDEHKLYKIYGEFVYYRKCKAMAKFFTVVNAVYFKPRVKCMPFAGGTMTDELAYQVACMKTGIYPHQDNFTPVFNVFLTHSNDKYLHTYQLATKYYALSIGGNKLPEHLKTKYNHLASYYAKAAGLQSHYKSADKKAFLPERKNL